jgi:HEAT repeat protein
MDGGSGNSRHIQDPEGLLRSALEKIVFFECRVSQLESELAAAITVAERARGDAAGARRREVELEQALAGERGQRSDLERRISEADARVRLLEAERERLMGGLVDRARIAGAPDASGAPEEEGQADLAGFIAELRAEIEALRAFKASAIAAGLGIPAAPCPQPAQDARRAADRAATVAELGGRFETAGRVGISAGDTARMKELFATRADRALYERSMADLDVPEAGRRLRAVHALEALGSRAAAPLLAAALGRERDADVKAALLGALARLKEPIAADLAERELADPRPAVRVAALEALAAVGGFRGAERLAAALADESATVRRRATLLLGFSPGERAEDALARALSDPDRGVARAAAAALSGRATPRAQAALARGLEHPEASVRQAAATALGRIAGETVDADGTASARRASCRRIVEKLAAMDGEQIRAAVLRSAATAKVTAEQVLAATAGRGGSQTRPSTPTSTSTSTTPTPTPTPTRTAPATATAHAARTAVAVLEAPAAPQPSGLEPQVLAEIRSALRGCTEDQLAKALVAQRPLVDAALTTLAARRAVERRGTRWFMS